ncbi:hypothetical protein ACJX0J_014181, partial [Zea mays]
MLRHFGSTGTELITEFSPLYQIRDQLKHVIMLPQCFGVPVGSKLQPNDMVHITIASSIFLHLANAIIKSLYIPPFVYKLCSMEMINLTHAAENGEQERKDSNLTHFKRQRNAIDNKSKHLCHNLMF